jgi:hypothetical protein
MNKRIFTDYVSTQLDMNDEAREVLRSIKGEVTDELYGKMCDSLVGFQEDLQLTIAVNLRDAVYFGFDRYTYIDHVDNMLSVIYLAIDKEMDRM